MGRFRLVAIVLCLTAFDPAHALDCTPMPVLAQQSIDVRTVIGNDEAVATGMSADALGAIVRTVLWEHGVPLATEGQINAALLEVYVLPHAFPGARRTLYAFSVVYRVHTLAALSRRLVHATVWERFTTGVSDGPRLMETVGSILVETTVAFSADYLLYRSGHWDSCSDESL